MWARLNNAVWQTCSALIHAGVPDSRQRVPAIERPALRTKIDTARGTRLDVLDRRPGNQVTIFVHGCGTTEKDVHAIERKVKAAQLAGTSYLLSWDGPDLTQEALAEGTRTFMQCVDLIMAAPSPMTLLMAGGVAASTMYQSIIRGGNTAFLAGLQEARRIARRFGDILDDIPEVGDGVRLNLVGHSMGAAVITHALAEDGIAERVRDALLLGSITTKSPTARRKTINVFSPDDEALARLGRTLGNGLAEDPELTHVEVRCAHTAYWNHLTTLVPKSWQVPREIRDAIAPPDHTPCPSGEPGHRAFEVRFGALEQK